MDFALNEEQKLIVSSVRRFAEKEIREAAADADRAAQVPNALLEAAGELGFFIDAVPERLDGLLEGDYSHVNRALRGFELGRGCAAIAALLESNVELALAVEAWGSEALKKSTLSELGPDTLAALYYDHSGALEIAPSGDGFVVSGSIGPSVCLATAKFVLVLAPHVGEGAAFVLPGTPGKSEAPSGWRAGQWARTTLDSVAVPGSHILGRGEQAHDITKRVLAWQKTSLAARAVGVAQAAIEYAVQYGDERVQFGQKIGSFESLRTLRDENETLVESARMLALRAAWELDMGASTAYSTASRARDLAADVVGRATIDALQMYGGYGFVNEFPVEKLMRDAPAFAALHGEEGLVRIALTEAEEN